MRQFRDSISAICIAAAWCDGELGDFEKQALDRIHVQLGFDRNEIMERIGHASQHGPSGESVDIPNDEDAQLEFMRLALAVCLADGSMNDHEVQFLSKLANFLSLSVDKLEELRQAAGEILDPKKGQEEESAPERIAALLPDQKIKLENEPSEDEGSTTVSTRPSYKKISTQTKPLSELLYEGEDYGGELALL